jgi:hypothetical protein
MELYFGRPALQHAGFFDSAFSKLQRSRQDFDHE